MDWHIEREQTTGLKTKSVFVLVENGGQNRRFEAAFVPHESDAQTYLSNNFTPETMWQAGQPISEQEQARLQAFKSAGDMEALKAFAQGLANKTESERWEWVVKQILLIRQELANEKTNSSNQKKR